MDETGFRIGIAKDQLVVTKRKRVHCFSMPENRESATAIEAISAGGSISLPSLCWQARFIWRNGFSKENLTLAQLSILPFQDTRTMR